MKSNLKIGLFFTNTNQDYNSSAASTWIRIWQMMDYYSALGCEVSLNNYFKRYDVAIVFRKSKRKYYQILRYLKLLSKTVYFDTCINLFEESDEVSSDRLKYAHKIAQAADGMICASNRIAEFTKPYAKEVFAMEDPVNLVHFKYAKKQVDFKNPIFGWSGVGEKSVFLNDYAKDIDGHIHIISDEQVKRVELRFKYSYAEWRYETFPKELLKCDIALLPRDVSSKYNQGHSSFKALVFAIAGIPIIANKVPSYLDMASYYDGIVFLEDFDNDIKRCVRELKGRNLNPSKVRGYYSCENQAEQLIRFFEKQLKD